MMKKRKESGVIPTQPLNQGRGMAVGPLSKLWAV